MENQEKKTINKYNYARSISDTDSQAESFHSPLHSIDSSPSKSIHNLHSPKPPHNFNAPSPLKSQPPLSMFDFNTSVSEEPSVAVERADNGGGKRYRAASSLRSHVAVQRAALGFRVSQMIVSLISFSVMASDKTQGWSGDSFDRYREYRYCLSVNVIAFVYSAFQAVDLTYHLIRGHATTSHLRYQFDFMMDQILAYLLISASSSAATRVDDWVSSWGKDPFTEKASASIGMSFLSFLAFAISSLLSGYNLCNYATVRS